MLGDRDRVRAAIIGDGNTRAAGSLKIDVVIAGGQQLHQPKPRRRTIERGIELHTRITDDVTGFAQR